MSLSQIQAEVETWARKNFGPPVPPFHRPLLGVVEEVGELAHAQLKKEQGIRGTAEEHDVKAMDAIGDICLYLMDYCNNRGWSLEAIVEETWDKVVSKRNWRENPLDGLQS